MSAVDDIIRVKQYFRQGAIEALMVSFWKVLTSDPAAPFPNDQMAEAFHEKYRTNVWPITGNNTAQYYKTVIDTAPDFEDFGEWEEIFNGGLTGQPAPSYVSIQVKQNVGLRTTRNGFKRLPFTSEDAIVGNAISLSPSQQDIIKDFWGEPQDFMNPLDEEQFQVWHPVVVGRINVGTAEAPDYEYDFTRVQLVTSAAINKNTHQNSRQR